MATFAFEKHYRVKELAGLWGLSPKTVSRIFSDEAGVVRVANEGAIKRKYATLTIPESVAARVHEKLTRPPTKEGDESRPIRIVRLRELGTIGPARKTAIKVKAAPSPQQ